MGSALWAGISGLNASTKSLDVIANNLANVNTIGFKAGTTYFADVLSSSMSGGGGGSMQVGRGVAVAEVQTQFGTGSFQATGNSTDVAIDGDGFFMVNDDAGATFYTRAGAFRLDVNGVLVDSNGNKAQGEEVISGVPSGTVGDISLAKAKSASSATKTISIGANINSGTATGGQYSTTQTVYDSLGAKHTLRTTFTKTESEGAGYWGVQSFLGSTEADVITTNGLYFDADGNVAGTYIGGMSGVYTITGGITAVVTASTSTALDRPGMVYKDTDAGGIVLDRTEIVAGVGGVWSVGTAAGYPNASVIAATSTQTEVDISLDGKGTKDLHITVAAVVAGAANAATLAFSLTHDETAASADGTIGNIGVTFSGTLPGGAVIGTNGYIKWDMASDAALDITQYSAPSVIRTLTADGYASGDLKTLSIATDGRISGFFTNGQTADLSQIVLAQFNNPWGLKKMGNNLFGRTIASGDAVQKYPGQSGTGTLTPSTLEMSNTDIATEFINMITAQKAYQANARVVTTQDAIMQELMNLKR